MKDFIQVTQQDGTALYIRIFRIASFYPGTGNWEGLTVIICDGGSHTIKESMEELISKIEQGSTRPVGWAAILDPQR